jgi:hypothetical protein
MRSLRHGVVAFGLFQVYACGHARPLAFAEGGSATPSHDARIEAAVCAGRPQCHLETAIDAGDSPSGRKGLFVAVVRVPSSVEPPCDSYDVWSGAFEGLSAMPLQRLVHGCWNGKPELAVLAPGEVRLNSGEGVALDTGARARTWPGGRDYVLDPPQFIRRFSHSEMWDYRAFEGASCNDDYPCPASVPTLPWVDIAGAFTTGDWRATRLGACSMRIAANARAVISGGALYIEVTDALPSAQVLIELVHIGGAPDDMVELHLAMDGQLSGGIVGTAPQVIGGHVELASTGDTRRFRVTGIWSSGDHSVRLSYGSGKLSPAFDPADHQYHFGSVRRVDPSEAVCVPHDGALEVTRHPLHFQASEDVPAL